MATEQPKQASPKNQPLSGPIITADPKQAELMKIDHKNDTLTVSQNFQDALNQMPSVIAEAKKYLDTDINELDEKDITALRKKTKPLKDYKRQFDQGATMINKFFNAKRDAVKQQYTTLLENAGFDQLEDVDRRLRELDKDIKANRKNQRWAKLKTYFDAQQNLYPDLQQLAPDTLGDFNHYRVTHPKMVSAAKSKPLRENDIKALNQDLYQYHENLTRLTQSGLGTTYQQQVIKEYAADPSTDHMLALIQTYQVKQAKDAQLQLENQFRPLATKMAQQLLLSDHVKAHLKSLADPHLDPAKLDLKITQLLAAQVNALAQSLIPSTFIHDNKIDETALRDTLINQAKAIMPEVIQAVKALAPQEQKPAPKPEASAKAKQSAKPKDPWAWLIDYLSTDRHYNNIHTSEKAKVLLLADLYNNMTDRSKIWRSHIKTPHDVLTITTYIMNL